MGTQGRRRLPGSHEAKIAATRIKGSILSSKGLELAARHKGPSVVSF